jgi:hypothetical protein
MPLDLTQVFLPRRAVLAAVVGAALSVGGAGVALSEETLKFGLADALTGPSAIFGKDQIQAVRWALDEINAKGGVNGRKLEAIILDHQAKSEVGIAVIIRHLRSHTAFRRMASSFNMVRKIWATFDKGVEQAYLQNQRQGGGAG